MNSLAKVTSIADILAESGLGQGDTAVWGHSRPQQQRGPRRLAASGVNFCPTEVTLADMTLDHVGQLAPKTFMKNMLICFEVARDGNKIAPKNGTNLACIICRKKIVLNCGRLMRVTAPAAAPTQ